MKTFLYSATWGLIMMLSCSKGLAQLQGIVKTSQQAHLPFCGVMLLNLQDSSLVKGTLTNENGIYTFDNVRAGNYFLLVSTVGYKKYSGPVFTFTGELIQLDPILLEEEVHELSEVIITGEKPLFEHSMDRITVNVQNSIILSGGSILDALQKSPGIEVNRQNSSLGLNGKQGVVIMINGKVSRMPKNTVMEMLAGMNSNMVEKIELMTTPPANFDAEGDAGFINIVLKKNTDYGTNGSYTINAGYGRAPKSGMTVNFNHRNTKLNLFGDYAYSYDKTYQESSNYREMLFNTVYFQSKNLSQRNAYRSTHNGKLGADWKISDKTILGAVAEGYNSVWKMDAVNTVSIGENEPRSSEIKIVNVEENIWNNYSLNLNALHHFGIRQTIAVDADYLYYHDMNPATYINYFTGQNTSDYETNTRSKKVTPIKMFIVKADYTRGLSDHVRLEVGFKSTNSRLSNDIGFEMLLPEGWSKDEQFTILYKLKESINAAYGSAHFTYSNTSVIAGLRWEHTFSDLTTANNTQSVRRDFHSLFPNIMISQKFKENLHLQLSYNRRISRPGYNDLAPFMLFVDPNTLFTGNTTLNSTIANIYKADIRYKIYSANLQYSNDINAIAEFQPSIQEESGKIINAAQNLDSRQTLSLMLSAPVAISSWWESQNNILGLYQSMITDYSGFDIKRSQASYRLNTMQTFIFPYQITFEVAAFYNSIGMQGIFKRRSYASFGFGMQKKFDRFKSNLRLSINDLFWTDLWEVYTNVPEFALYYEGGFKLEPHVVRLTFTKSFGNNNLKASRNRSLSTEEQRKRVGN